MCNQYHLLPTAVSSSLPLSGVFFVIQLRALYTAKQQGRGFCCYFFHWCPRWFGLQQFFQHFLASTPVHTNPFGYFMSRRAGQHDTLVFLMLCQTKAFYKSNLKSLKTANGIFEETVLSSIIGVLLAVMVNLNSEIVGDQLFNQISVL